MSDVRLHQSSIRKDRLSSLKADLKGAIVPVVVAIALFFLAYC
jgi:hypothetical protein